jgi:serine/threonine protein kinase
LADRPEKLNERYTLWEKIASGGMADVYRATEYGAKGSSKTVALKKILSNFSSNPEYRKMFVDEGIIGSQLTHSNICQVNPLMEIEYNLYIPMEFIEGKNLRQVINKYKKKEGIKPLPVPFALYIINEVFKGLDYAHTKVDENSGKPLNLVHRDMSPQNIMLSYQGGVKLIDFGIAKAKILTTETRAGVIKGKYSYMSPEQATGSNLGPQSDIFSTGIVLWELLTGERLFQSDNDMATLKAIQDCDLKDLEPNKKNPEVTAELNRIVMKALTKDLSLRYKTADLAQQNLNKYINEKYSSYSARDVKKFLAGLFAEEMIAEKKKANELYGTTVTNSQRKSSSSNKDFQQVERAFEGDITHTDLSESGGVTRTDMSQKSEESKLDLEDNATDESLSSNEATIMEVSQKTAVSIDQENYRVPSIFGEDKPLETRGEGSVTHAGVAVEIEVHDEVKKVDGPSAENSEEVSLAEITESRKLKARGAEASFNTESKNSNISVTNKTGSHVDLDVTGNESLTTEFENGEPSGVYQRGPTKQRWVSVFAIAAVVGTVYLYKMLFSGNLESLFHVFNSRGPTANSPSVTPENEGDKVSAEKDKKDVYQCRIQVDTDPPGATIYGDNFSGSSSTGIIPAPCDQAVVLRLEKAGYEPYKLTVDTTNKPSQKVPRVNLILKREGSIVLTLDNNASVYVDGQSYGNIQSNSPVEFRLTPGVHKFVFRNEVLGLVAEKQFQILDKERTIINQTIRLNDINPSQAP